MQSQAALTDWHTLAEIRAALHAGRITGGMTLELSIAHPELQDASALNRFTSYVSAYGVRIERNRLQDAMAVYLRRPS